TFPALLEAQAHAAAAPDTAPCRHAATIIAERYFVSSSSFFFVVILSGFGAPAPLGLDDWVCFPAFLAPSALPAVSSFLASVASRAFFAGAAPGSLVCALALLASQAMPIIVAMIWRERPFIAYSCRPLRRRNLDRKQDSRSRRF